ncbi:hypothetical protein F4780DRAFT_379777 [Xylariomycetidae sp. FL0641]|nr:hypothetical protein F4780DRAFT_379777 [Xylariomycetidae sp. FL0641]
MSDPLTFLVAFSAVFGASEGIRQIQADAKRKEHRSRKNNLTIRCLKSSQYSAILEGRQVVLSGDKLYADTGTDYQQAFGHPFAGYYLPYPDRPYSGLVSTISDEPPMMNWIYVDRDTYEVKFGTRPWAEPNWPGPFDCSRQEHRLTFGGWEGFLLVQEGSFWALYFDVDRDKLSCKVVEGTPILEVELLRVEMRVRPPKIEPPSNEDPEGKEAEATATEKTQPPGRRTNGGGSSTQGQDNLESPDVD